MFTLVGNTVLPSPNSCSFKHSSSLVKSVSINYTSFAVTCTINTCILPEDGAISASKTTHSETSSNPDSVIAFFQNNGFSDTDISKITKTIPSLLRCSVDKTLKPKFEFFISQGISGSELAKVLCKEPNVLKASMKNKIIPYFEVMRSIVHTDANLIALLKRSLRVLIEDPQKNLIANVALLRAHGVPSDIIVKSLLFQPPLYLRPTSSFGQIVEEVEKMKFEPKKYLFLVALHALSQMSRSTLEAKFDVYKQWGLSEDELQFMFRKCPYCLMLSDKNIMSTMNFLVNEMGYSPSLVAKCPAALGLSLERRIIPRSSVIQVLKAKGLVGKRSLSATLLQMSEEEFLRKFVIKFEKEIPEVLTAYKGKGR